MKDKGIHHISIISGDPQVNADFYVKTLGLRMVLKTVNQDDPGTYHLFYANGEGQPGSSITFFPWSMAMPAKPGTGRVSTVSFTVPEGSCDFWIDRFAGKDVRFDSPINRFGKKVLPFYDPDGLKLELIEDKKSEAIPAWDGSTVPAEFSIRGFWGSNLQLTRFSETVDILREVMGFQQTEENDHEILLTTESNLGHSIIIEKAEEPKTGTSGTGYVHHIAFRAKDEDDLKEMRQKVIDMGLSPTQLIDRHVFMSVYFQTPGGVLFEIATDGPGYKSVAESEEEMGKKLFLPPWLEPRRDLIEKRLQPVNV
ncbi:MAG: VOC family protein [Balneolaceae bacterium]|nr:VOC family protein [Balneolaceae bacterium]